MANQWIGKVGSTLEREDQFFDRCRRWYSHVADYSSDSSERVNACAKCSFYVPKNSSQVQLVQGKANLLQLRQEIPLTDSELAAVDDGVVAIEKLLEQLNDVRTPAGPTPQELGAGRG